ncbi:MAG TPA: PTS fructose transporter subunit IIA [Planctomycetaceae bacterium]|jgi:PTS system nitrogen regulatory IIA component|nr:PTS fructose transporter subunit IIA [Planctomycetaceae bacterium]
MKLSEFVVRDSILIDLQAETKDQAIRAMVESLAKAGGIQSSEQEAITGAILKREELGSTGIGRGVAVPHTKHPSADRLVATIAISKEGVEFASLDGEAVHILFLLVSPHERPGDHLRALENISRHLRNDNFCSFLRQANSAKAVIDLLEEADNNQLG